MTAEWPCADYTAPITCLTTPKPKTLLCSWCRSIPAGDQVQDLYRSAAADRGRVQEASDLLETLSSDLARAKPEHFSIGLMVGRVKQIRAALDEGVAGAVDITSSFEARRLPGDTTTCQRCREPIIWAVTTARPSGPGGKPMPLDPIEHPDGNVSVQPGHGGRLLARVLAKDERHSPPVEFLAMPHFATCGNPAET